MQIVYEEKEREEKLTPDKGDPFAIPEGLQIGDEYKVPFDHPKEGQVEITIYIKEGEQGLPMRHINISHAVLLTRRSRETASKMIANVKRYKFDFMGNVQLLRYDDLREAIAAAHRPILDKDSSDS